MELKNALSICLISLVSAALVMLIARSLDSQAASRLQPQLERIAAELQAIRSAGRVADGPMSSTPHDALVAFYFHGDQRCRTCRTIEAQTYDTIVSEFPAQLERGDLVWQTLSYDESPGKEWAQTFEVQAAVVVLAWMKDGQPADWRRLDEVWGLVGDKQAFATFIRDAVTEMLGRSGAAESVDGVGAAASRIPPSAAGDAQRPGAPAPGDSVQTPVPG